MDMFACMLKCTCGGTVESLVDQIYYILTEDNCIIFRGVCNTCGENAQVKKGYSVAYLPLSKGRQER